MSYVTCTKRHVLLVRHCLCYQITKLFSLFIRYERHVHR